MVLPHDPPHLPITKNTHVAPQLSVSKMSEDRMERSCGAVVEEVVWRNYMPHYLFWLNQQAVFLSTTLNRQSREEYHSKTDL